MAFLFADRVKETSTTTGTGTLDLAGAATGYRTFVAGIGTTNTCPYVIEDANGTAWECGIGTVTDATPDTLARTTLLSSSTGSAISLSAGTHTVFCDWPAGRAQQATLEHVAGTDADTTMTVGQMYVVDMSAWATADRNYTLPATAAVGDRIGVMVSAGDASHELILKANTGDTLNGVSAAEWSRLMITGEVVIMRCVVSNATWIVECDGRIPCKAMIYLSTDADGEGVATFTLPTAAATPGAWTEDHNIGMTVDTATDKITVRRAGKYNAWICGRSKDSLADTKYFQIELFLNNTTSLIQPSAYAASANTLKAESMAAGYAAVVGDYFQFRYRSQDGAVGCRGFGLITQLSMQELL
jgi:hypothetical protein